MRGFAKICEIINEKIEKGIMLKIIDVFNKCLILLSKVLSLLQNGSLSSALRLMSFGVLVLLSSVVFLFIGGR